MSEKKIPFNFVLDELHSLTPVVRPMFGCHAIYVREKIMIILRDKPVHPEANGIWIATSNEYHDYLRKKIGKIKSVYILSGGKAETNWQMIGKKEDDFEEKAIRICQLIIKGDLSIGKIPKRKTKRQKTA